MRKGSLLSAVVLTTMAVLLTGCSRNPVAPTLDRSAAPGAGTAAVAVVPDDPPPADGGTPGTITESFVATSEGTMTVGRWTLWFRKNSLTQPTTITMRVTDPEAMDVQIDVQPPAANNFAQSLVLTANTSDLSGFDYGTASMAVWSNGDWQPASKKTASGHPNQQNVVGHCTTLASTMITTGGNVAAE